MRLRFWLFAFLCLTAPTRAALAEDWRLQTVEGSASVFAAGDWSAAPSDAAVAANAIILTAPDGRVLLSRAGDRLELAPGVKIKIEGESSQDTLARDFEGVLGVAESPGLTKRFVVMTTHAAANVSGAVFGVASDAQGTTIAVAEGLVSVTDLAGHGTTEVRAGQTIRVALGGTGELLPSTADDPAALAARDAAGRLASTWEGAAELRALDPRAVGAIKPGGAGDGKSRYGTFNSHFLASAHQVLGDLEDEPDIGTVPWDDDFKWTEVEHGELRLKPIHKVVLGLTGWEAYKFWTLAILGCIVLGALTTAVLNEAGFGITMNTALVMLAFVVAVLVRDAFFRGTACISVEPFLSLGMMIGAMPLLLLASAFAKMRLNF